MAVRRIRSKESKELTSPPLNWIPGCSSDGDQVQWQNVRLLRHHDNVPLLVEHHRVIGYGLGRCEPHCLNSASIMLQCDTLHAKAELCARRIYLSNAYHLAATSFRTRLDSQKSGFCLMHHTQYTFTGCCSKNKQGAEEHCSIQPRNMSCDMSVVHPNDSVHWNLFAPL